MKLIYKFAEMTPEKRPQDPHLDGTGLLFETMEHGGNILTRCHKLSADRRRGPLVHLRSYHAGRQGGRQPRVMLDAEDE